MKKQVTVCGVKYAVEYLTQEQDSELAVGFGYCDRLAHRIVIDKDVDKEQRALTLRHELIHAFLFECGIGKWSNDEKLVTFLELQLPKLVELCVGMDVLPLPCNNDLNMTKAERQRYYANLDKLKEQNARLLERDGSLNDALKERFEQLAADTTLSDDERKQSHNTLTSMAAVLKMASWEQIRLLMALQHSPVTKTQIYELIDFCNTLTVAKQHLDEFKNGGKNGK